MPLKTFSTPFTESMLGMLLISPNNGTGFTLSDPGTYTLSCIVDWYHSTSDSQALGSMTKVTAGVEVTLEVTDTPVTWYCKIEHVGDQAPLVFKYDQPSPGASLAGLTGATNTGLGEGTLASLTSGITNTAVGVNAGNAVTSGQRNTLIGERAGLSLNSGSQNTAVGRSAGESINTGNNNTALGYGSLTNLQGADEATAIGAGALAAATVSGTAVGYSALHSVSTGTDNTAVGANAGNEISSGSGNAMIGKEAGKGQGNVSNKFMVGLGNGQGLIFSVDEGGNLLNISVRYADGSMKASTGLALS